MAATATDTQGRKGDPEGTMGGAIHQFGHEASGYQVAGQLGSGVAAIETVDGIRLERRRSCVRGCHRNDGSTSVLVTVLEFNLWQARVTLISI